MPSHLASVLLVTGVSFMILDMLSRCKLIAFSFLQEKAAGTSSSYGKLPPKAPGHPASADDTPFGTRKARSSFGRGFFKIKSNKRTASAPNLGMLGFPLLG